MKTSRNLAAVFFLGSIVLGACSKKEEVPQGLYLSGHCKVEVKAEPQDAEIFLDGISIGTGAATTSVPCGEKQVLVQYHGFAPYYAYHVVDPKRALKMSVSLARLDKGENSFELSNELVDQIREGQRIWNPAQGPRPESKDESFPPYMGDMNALIASVKGAGTASGAAGAEGFEVGNWESVEDWR